MEKENIRMGRVTPKVFSLTQIVTRLLLNAG